MLYCCCATKSSDIDECEMDKDDCHENADCTDTVGSYNCTCFSGYHGNGSLCTGIFIIIMHI